MLCYIGYTKLVTISSLYIYYVSRLVEIRLYLYSRTEVSGYQFVVSGLDLMYEEVKSLQFSVCPSIVELVLLVLCYYG